MNILVTDTVKRTSCQASTHTALYKLQIITMTILGGPSIDEKDNQVRQSIQGLMRKLFQNNVSNRTLLKFLQYFIIYYLGSWEREGSLEKVLLRNFC